MKCRKCATENSNAAKFCKGCGFDVQQTTMQNVGDPERLPLCLKCNASHTPSAKFCKACGTSTASAAAENTPPPVVAPPAQTASLPASKVVAPPTATPSVPHPTVRPVSSPEARPEAVTDIPNSARLPPETPPAPADTQTASTTPHKKSPWNPAYNAPASVDPQINLMSKKTGPSRYVIGGSALAAVLVLAGAGAYWFSSSNAKPSAVPLAKQVSPPAPVATPVALVPASTPAPMPAEIAASSTLPASPVTPVPLESTTTTKATAAPATDAEPAKALEAQPPVTTPVVDPKLNNAEDQRRAKEAALRKRAEREALANQRARDKEKLNKTNRTLDDLLK